MYKNLIFSLCILCGSQSFAGELTHGFVNPDFGGNPLNGTPLLANANAQNSFTVSGSTGYVPPAAKTPQQILQANIINQMLSTLSQNIVTNAASDYTVVTDATNNTVSIINKTTDVVLVTLDLNSMTTTP